MDVSVGGAGWAAVGTAVTRTQLLKRARARNKENVRMGRIIREKQNNSPVKAEAFSPI
jgi:hypothetical protein